MSRARLSTNTSVTELRHQAQMYAAGRLPHERSYPTFSSNSHFQPHQSPTVTHLTPTQSIHHTQTQFSQQHQAHGHGHPSRTQSHQHTSTSGRYESQRRSQTNSYRSSGDREYSDSGSSDYSDSGCSTCSGSRHDDYSSAYYSSSSGYSHPRSRRNRHSGGRHTHEVTNRTDDANDHADCVSCTSSCSCSSGCDSQDSHIPSSAGKHHARRHSHRRRHSMERQSSAGGTGSHIQPALTHHSRVGTREQSRMATREASREQSRSASRDPSRRASRVGSRRASQSSLPQGSIHADASRVASLVNTQRSQPHAHHSHSSRRSASADLTGHTLTIPIGGGPPSISGVPNASGHTSARSAANATAGSMSVDQADEANLNESSIAGSGTQASGLGNEEELSDSEEAQQLALALQRAQSDALHVTFESPRDGPAGMGTSTTGHTRGDPVGELQKQHLYDSALACMQRAEQGFHAYVLTNEHSAGLSSADPHQQPPASILLRKLLRYEPRKSSKHDSHVSSDVPVTGSGNLVWYDLVLDGENRPQKFRLSQREQEEVERLRELERARDLNQDGSRSDSGMDEYMDPQDTPFLNEKYASLLKERKTLKLTIERRAGLVPIRRIREMRAGITPGATRLVNLVNTHFDELSIAEDETIIAEHCVSLLLDSGIKGNTTAQAQAHVHDASCYSASSGTGPRSEHDRKHLACIEKFNPSVCPRVQSSFDKANSAASRLLQRQIRRNQRKNFGKVTSAWGTSSSSTYGVVQGDLNTSSFGHSSAGGHNGSFMNHSTASANSASAGGSGIAPSGGWVVLATNSREEASILLNSLMFLKMVSGRRVVRKTKEEIERQRQERRNRVEIPLAGSPLSSPQSSPVRPPSKRTKFGHSGTATAAEDQRPKVLLQPAQLTSALMMSAAEHVALQDQARSKGAASSVAGTHPAGSSMSHRSFLKRKSVPTPSVKANFAVPGSAQSQTQAQGQLQQSTRSAHATSTSNKENHPPKHHPKTLSAQWKDAVEKSEQQLKGSVHGPAKEDVEESKQQASIPHQPQEDTEMVDALAAANTSTASHPQASSTAIFTPSQLSTSLASSIPAVAPSAPASVDEWLAKKHAQEEAAKLKAERKLKKEQEEKLKKQHENAEAMKKWKAKQEELEKKRLAKEKRAAEKKAAAEAEKSSLAQARKEACLKAYANFLQRSEQKKKQEEEKSLKSSALASAAQRQKKAEAKKKYDEWIKSKSDWFVRRVQQIKKRAKERRERGDGDMNEEDPEEEAALDWQWLEKEVEAELSHASGAIQQARKAKGRGGASVGGKPSTAATNSEQDPDSFHLSEAGVSSTEREYLSANVDGDSDDANMLYQVLDEVDMELWSKLMSGLESTRAEVERLRTQQPMSPLAQALEEQDRARVHVATRIPMPTPLKSLHEQDPRQHHLGNPGPMKVGVIHDDSLQLGSTADAMEYGSSFGNTSGASSHGAAGLSANTRASPFPTDPRQVAKESVLRPAATSGTYTQLTAQRGGTGNMSTAGQHAYDRSRTVVHHPFPPPQTRAYTQWVRQEMHEVIAQDDHPRPKIRTSTAPSTSATAYNPHIPRQQPARR